MIEVNKKFIQESFEESKKTSGTKCSVHVHQIYGLANWIHIHVHVYKKNILHFFKDGVYTHIVNEYLKYIKINPNSYFKQFDNIFCNKAV